MKALRLRPMLSFVSANKDTIPECSALPSIQGFPCVNGMPTHGMQICWFDRKNQCLSFPALAFACATN